MTRMQDQIRPGSSVRAKHDDAGARRDRRSRHRSKDNRKIKDGTKRKREMRLADSFFGEAAEERER